MDENSTGAGAGADTGRFELLAMKGFLSIKYWLINRYLSIEFLNWQLVIDSFRKRMARSAAAATQANAIRLRRKRQPVAGGEWTKQPVELSSEYGISDFDSTLQENHVT
ncbi:MAG TPA: hypothetical protein PLL06_10040 [Acidobacteriota bacterium]|nr:hypothetical protein [Acidobacteriota bacterium]HND19444.1 hypothetical protein [Acidobacteriota bacterium]HNJ40415.1 hypothetical protein [Acidobacteriota bacterium]